jgi:hypothetical protein
MLTFYLYSFVYLTGDIQLLQTEVKKVTINEHETHHNANLQMLLYYQPISVAERSKAWVCSRSSAGIAGSNLAEDMAACLL